MARPRVTESEAVLEAAARRLASHGIGATTVDDVAAEAGVSRATVYRYVGGKDEIVQAVIGHETDAVLGRLEAVIAEASTVDGAIADIVATALSAIEASPVLARLSSTDLRDTLPFVTVDAAPLVSAIVTAVGGFVRSAPGLESDDSQVDDAMEELARFVLTHLTTPRRDGSRLAPRQAGARAAAMIGPLIEPGDAKP